MSTVYLSKMQIAFVSCGRAFEQWSGHWSLMYIWSACGGGRLWAEGGCGQREVVSGGRLWTEGGCGWREVVGGGKLSGGRLWVDRGCGWKEGVSGEGCGRREVGGGSCG